MTKVRLSPQPVDARSDVFIHGGVRRVDRDFLVLLRSLRDGAGHTGPL